MTQNNINDIAYHANLKSQEADCILRYMLIGLPEQKPADVLMFSWCIDQGYIDYDDEVNRYVVTQKGIDHVSDISWH